MERSESIKELAAALCAFQSSVETIRKSDTNPFFKSKYASLSSILDVIKAPLAENGLSFVQFPSGDYGLTTMLMHTSGEWISDTYRMRPTKDDPQGAGSVITYQRRYALGAILGLNIDEDDDGNKASTPAPKKGLDKKVLLKGSETWNKAVEFLRNGGALSEITKTYYLSRAEENELFNEVNKKE